MKTKPTLTVNLHCEEGRGFFQLDLSSLYDNERAFLTKVFEKSDKGNEVEFGVDTLEDGRPILQFTLGKKNLVN